MSETFAYDPLGNLTEHGAAVQTFGHLTKPHAITGRVDAQATYTYAHDHSGNVQSVQTRARSQRIARG